MRGIALACVTLLIIGLLAYFFLWRTVTVTPPGAPGAPATRASSLADTRSFLEAVDRDDLETVKSLLERWPELARTQQFDSGETALHHAPSVAMAQLLIEHGADPAARDRDAKATPARRAAAQWRDEVRKFLETKAPPDQDIAYLAATGQAERLSQELIKAPDQLEFRTAPDDVLGGGRHLLHVAATLGQKDVVRVLLESGADPSVDGGWNNSQPLENAAWAGYPEIVKLLVDHGADLEARDSGANHTALWYAAVTGRTEVVRILLDAGAKIEDGMIAAVQDSKTSPYFGRKLPEPGEYDAVIALLREHGGKD